MSPRRGGVAVLTALGGLAMALVGPTPATADGDGNGTFGGTGTTPVIGVWAMTSSDGEPVDADDPSGPRRWVRRATPDPRQPSDPIAGICNPGPDPATGAVRFGWPFTIETVDTIDGRVVGSSRICVPLPGADPGVPPEPDYPVPPSYGEIWKAAAITPPTIGLNPVGEGVTGLPTRLWATSPDTVTITASIRGYTATGTATRTEFRFVPGDGTPTVRRVDGGRADAPAVAHVYERRGDVQLRAGARWVATVTVSGPDLPPTTIDLGAAIVTVSRDYHVVEVRSRLTS